ncbi:hypothetical protein V8G54_037741 [Vigna mungo]|uniref:Uncharacterized protein n=1 Tax=Vigna mungo TaxID=3915 RepID=A0AAQ3MJF5_VIGMU
MSNAESPLPPCSQPETLQSLGALDLSYATLCWTEILSVLKFKSIKKMIKYAIMLYSSMPNKKQIYIRYDTDKQPSWNFYESIHAIFNNNSMNFSPNDPIQGKTMSSNF